ncbi:MAG: OmpA family protein [Bacteroidetes bacterium]|nr:OmpA family protein [Bacteroidota bacterium]
MRTFRWLLWIVLLGVSVAASGQYTKEFKRIFFDADYLNQTGFYEEAFNRYKNLLTLDPGNSNILFLCGACCLEIPGNEQLAVTYLQEAAAGVSLSYKDRSPKEPGAPVLTYYMLGRAYHLNNNFPKAVENYELYREAAADEDPMLVEFAEMQIEACNRAVGVVKNYPSFEFQSVLDHFEDDLPSCNNPVISGDGNILIFLVDYPNDKKIMMTHRDGSFWTRPRVINSEIGMVGETYPVCLSYDGKDLYLVHQFYSHSDIFISRIEGNRWSEAEALGSNVNGRTSEPHASVSRDGNTLYFVSDARGGKGSFDIYVSSLDEKGEWGPSTNLGPVINTPFEEHTPFISSNDSILFFSSQGHAGIGGLDVFYSELGADGQWMEPINLGYPVNTTGENVFFNPGWNELDGYYAVRRPDDPTSNTLNMVIELEPPEVHAEEQQPAAIEQPAEIATIVPAPAEELSDEEEQLPVAIEQPAEIATIVPAPVEEKEVDVSTMEKALEPEETDEILEVLNKGVVDEPAEVVESTATSTPPPSLPGATRLQTTVPFEHNASELIMAAVLEVERVADLMQTFPETNIHISGHADATGSTDYNLWLSSRRANKIAKHLEMKGVDRGRISLEGKGEKAPVARNAYPDGSDAPLGRYLNRQVILTIESPEPIRAELSGLFVPTNLRPETVEPRGQNDFYFTIQVLAKQSPTQVSEFKGIDKVKEFACKDNFYRYTCGEYHTYEEASIARGLIRESGYPDAFIQTMEWYSKAVR